MQSHQMKRAAGNSAPTDPNFKQTVLLLHGDGTNGGQNNTFIDSSTNNFTITHNGNTTQGTFSPFSQSDGYWSNYFDGSGDELTLSTTTAAQIGSGDFSFECFVYATKSTNTFAQGLISYGIVGQTSGTSYASFQLSPTGYLNFFYAQTSSATLADPTLFPLNQWVHAVVCRSSSTISMFVNGSRVATASTSATVGSTGDRITIGGQWFANNTGRQLQSGYISNARIVKGSSAYDASQSSLSVPASNLTAITNTSLLTCQSNRFIDNSSNAFTITSNGDTAVTAFSPFAPTAAYVASTNGGSGYFDGTGDYLSVANSNTFDTDSTYTLEAWFYQSSAGNDAIFCRGGGAASWSTSNGHQILLFIDSGTIYLQFNTSGSPTSITTTAPAAGQWNHVAVGYNGTTTRFWLNGASVGSSTNAYTMPTTRNIVRIGAEPSGTSYAMNGYIGNVRFVKGTDVYGVSNTSITVPTAPLTAITNTALLTSFTNAAILDNTGKNDLETVGNAQISTSVVKYGTGSMYFDGTGDGLKIKSSSELTMGTGNWTIEFWAYHASTSGQQTYVGDTPGNTSGPYVYKDTSHKVGLYYSSQILTGTTTLSATTWYHIAVARSSGTVKLFINGTEEASASDTTNLTVSIQWVGADDTSNFMNGYIDDLRITKGVARYTANFTVPARAFPDK